MNNEFPSDGMVRRRSSVRPLIMLMWSIPLMWVLGGERLLFPLLVLAFTFRAIPRDGKFTRPILWFGAFLIAYLASITQVAEPDRYITFLWDFSIYLSMLLTIMYIVRGAFNLDEIESILQNLVLITILFHVIAMTYFVLGDWRFETLLGKALPGGLKNTQIGQKIAIHGVGRELYFLGVNTRLASIFTSSMQYAAVTLLVTPMALYFFLVKRGWMRLAFAVALILCLLGLFFSQGRTAMVISAVALPVVFVCFVLSKVGMLSNKSIASTGLAVILLGAPIAMAVLPFAYEAFDFYFVQQRAASYEERSEVYRQSWDQIGDSPLLGHGTQVTVEDLNVPLGSHNWYLGVLFKHGMLGLVPLLAFLLYVVNASLRSIFFVKSQREKLFAIAIFLTIASHLLLCLTAEPVVDAIHVFFLSVIYGCALAFRAAGVRQHELE